MATGNLTVATVEPTLIHEIRKFGIFDLNGCYNCTSCTIVCPITDFDASFPRRLMLLVRFGIRDEIVKSVEPWLCYYCGDCSETCPRDAKPGESMMTLRRYLSSVYDFTGLTKKLYSSLSFRVLSEILVALTTFFLIVAYHFLVEKLMPGEFFSTAMGLEHMFNLIIPFTVAVFAIPVILLLVNGIRMFSHLKKDLPKIPLALYFTELKTLFANFFAQVQMLKCTRRTRWVKHFLIFVGFMTMSIVVLFFLPWFQTEKIFPITHPQRWIGYIATILLLYGSIEIIWGRVKKNEPIHEISEPSDWILPVMILLTTLTGILTHIFRYLEMDMLSHYFYFAHIVIVVPMLLIEIPFGKLSHVLYRPIAIYVQRLKESATVMNEVIL